MNPNGGGMEIAQCEYSKNTPIRLNKSDRIPLARALCEDMGHTVISSDELARLKRQAEAYECIAIERNKARWAAEDAAKPEPLTPEQIKEACEEEAKRRGLDVEFKLWSVTDNSNYMTSLKTQDFPSVCYSKTRDGAPRIVLHDSGVENGYYDTIQDAITAFMDEVEKVVKPEPEKKDDGWKTVGDVTGIQIRYRRGKHCSDVIHITSSLENNEDEAIFVGESKRIPLARVLCDGMGYEVVENKLSVAIKDLRDATKKAMENMKGCGVAVFQSEEGRREFILTDLLKHIEALEGKK